MDGIKGPFYSGPIFPIGSRDKNFTPPQRLKGKIIGVRPGRSGEKETTQILTIKLTSADLDDQKLLHSDVEIVVQPHA